MSCLSSTVRARITATLNKKLALLAILENAYEGMLSNIGVERYRFDSGEAAQWATMRKPGDVSKEIDRLESQISRLYRQLEGTGIVNMNLRRR